MRGLRTWSGQAFIHYSLRYYPVVLLVDNDFQTSYYYNVASCCLLVLNGMQEHGSQTQAI
jgi:hypothetical protein